MRDAHVVRHLDPEAAALEVRDVDGILSGSLSTRAEQVPARPDRHVAVHVDAKARPAVKVAARRAVGDDVGAAEDLAVVQLVVQECAPRPEAVRRLHAAEAVRDAERRDLELAHEHALLDEAKVAPVGHLGPELVALAWKAVAHLVLLDRDAVVQVLAVRLSLRINHVARAGVLAAVDVAPVQVLALRTGAVLPVRGVRAAPAVETQLLVRAPRELGLEQCDGVPEQHAVVEVVVLDHAHELGAQAQAHGLVLALRLDLVLGLPLVGLVLIGDALLLRHLGDALALERERKVAPLGDRVAP